MSGLLDARDFAAFAALSDFGFATENRFSSSDTSNSGALNNAH